jgi:hypothetical protein
MLRDRQFKPAVRANVNRESVSVGNVYRRAVIEIADQLVVGRRVVIRDDITEGGNRAARRGKYFIGRAPVSLYVEESSAWPPVL